MLSIKEVAERLGVSPTVIRRLVLHGHLRAVRIGRSWRISQVAIDAYCALYANTKPE
jgi:excisionase family DNA binding protein